MGFIGACILLFAMEPTSSPPGVSTSIAFGFMKMAVALPIELKLLVVPGLKVVPSESLSY